MRIFVCFVVMLFVDVCHQWACKLEDMKLLVRLVQDGDVGPGFVRESRRERSKGKNGGIKNYYSPTDRQDYQ